MAAFILLAIALTVAAVALITVPLVIKRGDGASAPASQAALAAALVIVIGAAAGYAAWSNWTWASAPEGNLPQNMVARLARRLEHSPEDLQGWLMLGHSYVVLEQLPLALRAYERADRLARGANVDAIVGMAEALALGDPAELDGRAGRLIERALALDPNSGKALFYGAAAALRRGALPLARERFAKLLTLGPPPNVRPVLQQQIAAIDRELAGGPAPEAAPAGAAAPDSPPATPSPPGAAMAPGGASVRINVVLSPKLGAPGDPSESLFLIVKDPRRPGPPLAVKRLTSHFPQRIDLTPADSMIPERRFALGEQVQVIARIARSGQAMGARGDPFGEISYRVGRDGLVDVVIDRITP
jgi:cytochrome c-type biogenesis protein CcmH